MPGQEAQEHLFIRGLCFEASAAVFDGWSPRVAQSAAVLASCHIAAASDVLFLLAGSRVLELITFARVRNPEFLDIYSHNMEDGQLPPP